MWLVFALLSALFAALVAVLSKIGLEGISSNLATAIRTVVVLAIAWGIVFFSGAYKQLPAVSERNWWFLVASGIATGISWLCYFKALQLGDVSKVVSVDKFSIVLTVVMAILFLNETFSFKTIVGCILITAGTLFMI